MRRVALIYSPAAGQHSRLRKVIIDDALAVLRLAGVEAEVLETYAPGSAGTQALEAVRRGCDSRRSCMPFHTIVYCKRLEKGIDESLEISTR
jgi:hypothetical protein